VSEFSKIAVEPTMLTILLVEDEPVLRANLAEELREAGFTVIEAASADEAWRYLQATGPVDLVFSDIQMPGTMSGIDLQHRVRTNFPGTKIILTSGNAGPTKPDVEIFLPKPYGLGKAVEVSAQLLCSSIR
jgi:CheY-like chemotaxis protein